MNRFNETRQKFTEFRLRVIIAGIFVFICFGITISRFMYLQILNHNKYLLKSEANRIMIIPIIPDRGIIRDRNGLILANNFYAYTLEITVSKINDTLDNIIKKISKFIKIREYDLYRFKKLLYENGSLESLPIRTRLTDVEVAKFIAKQYKFPGIEIKSRLFRKYPFGMTSAHVIGYIGRISTNDKSYIKKQENLNNQYFKEKYQFYNINNYNGTNYIGKTGIERSYESELHGYTGFKVLELNASGRVVRTIEKIQSIPGNDLTLSIDIKLQEVAKKAFTNKRGALVAIDPSNGEILAFVSTPSFDPNIFIDGIDNISWNKLNKSLDYPLLNRPLRGTYPPGSTYKPFMALAALAMNKRTPNWKFYDPGYYIFGGHTFRNDVRSGQGWVDMNRAIMVSNDTYFYMLAHDLGVNAIASFMKSWGFGQITGIDIPGEAKGVLPSTEWKRSAYQNPSMRRWYEGETISLGIGQGYNSFTILQLAHAIATLANNGIPMRPHLTKKIRNPTNGNTQIIPLIENERIRVKQSDIDFVKHSMENVNMNSSGTASRVFKNAPYESAGKTGTAQVFSLKGHDYRAHNIAEKLRDHSLFIGFAPSNNSKIAIAVIVENGGWGISSAAPIARKVIDYYLK